MKCKIYLDLNIYSDAYDNKDLYNYIMEKKVEYDFYYSPAHIEEVFKGLESSELNQIKMRSLLDLINDITDKKELFPTNDNNSAIYIKKEDTRDCFERVFTIDTREHIATTSKEKFDADKKNNEFLREIGDEHVKKIPYSCYQDIWKNPYIINYIADLNENLSVIIEKQNIENSLFLVDRSVSNIPMIKQGMIEDINRRFNDLEYFIEILFRILTYAGYKNDKNIATAISGTHDCTHAIYAISCDYLITCDKRFAERCSALYYYLGASTLVKHCKKSELLNDIKEVLN